MYVFTCCHFREGTNIEVRVEIETQPRGARQSSLSSILSNRSLSVESVGRTQSQFQDYPCASEVEDCRDEKEQEGQDKPEAEEGAFPPVFETDTV